MARSALLFLLLALSSAAGAQPGARPSTATDEAKSIVTEPLEDTNIRRRQVPAALARISDRPYSLAGLKTCRQIAAAVTELNGALGPDVDTPPQASSGKGRQAVTVVKEVIGSFVPGRGLVREISGANKAERDYEQAIYAGLARRAFLKGVGKQRGCRAPAAPVS